MELGWFMEQLLTNDSPLITAICIICAIPVAWLLTEYIKRELFRLRWNRKHKDDKRRREGFLDMLMKIYLK